jgi:hypothetical protein
MSRFLFCFDSIFRIWIEGICYVMLHVCMYIYIYIYIDDIKIFLHPSTHSQTDRQITQRTFFLIVVHCTALHCTIRDDTRRLGSHNHNHKSPESPFRKRERIRGGGGGEGRGRRITIQYNTIYGA